MVPWVGLQFVIVVFPDHTHLLFNELGSGQKTVYVTFDMWYDIVAGY